MKILRRSSVDFKKYDEIFLKLKIKKNREDFYCRSSKDLNKIFIEDLRKSLIRFKLKIFERSQKDFTKKLYLDILKIFRRKFFGRWAYCFVL